MSKAQQPDQAPDAQLEIFNARRATPATNRAPNGSLEAGSRVRILQFWHAGYEGDVARVERNLYYVKVTPGPDDPRREPFESGPYVASELEVLS